MPESENSDEDRQETVEVVVQPLRIRPPAVADFLVQQEKFVTTRDENAMLYHYDDGIYNPDGELVVKEWLKNNYSGHLTTHFLREVILHVKISTYTPLDELNKDPHRIHVASGILNLRANNLEPFTPTVIATNRVPILHDPEADAPKTMEFMEDVLDTDDIPKIQKFYGYCLWKATPAQVMFLLYGPGRNGRSTLLSHLEMFLGKENISGVSLHKLSEIESRYSAAEPFQKLANICADIPAKEIKDSSLLKALTTGDLVRARRIYGRPFNYHNYSKLIFSANDIPPSLDTSFAWFRRWVLIPMFHTFEGADDDPDILKKITTPEEMSGTLNWAIEGLAQLRLDEWKFTPHLTTEENWNLLSNPAKAFADEYLRYEYGSRVEFQALWENFTVYCRRGRLIRPTRKELTQAVIRKFKGSDVGSVSEWNPATSRTCRRIRNVDTTPDIVELEGED